MKRLLTLVLLSVFVFGPTSAFAQKQSKGNVAVAASTRFGNVDAISAKQLKDYLTFIASDELEGRDTPSRGLDIAAMFIAQHLSSWGLKPAGGDGTFFQKVPLRLSKVDAEKTTLKIGEQSFVYGKDFLATQFQASIADAPMIFVGNGWVVKSKNIDPYTGLDIKDKVIVVLNGPPKGVTNADLPGADGGAWMSPTYYAQTHGAKGVITFASYTNLSNWETSKYNASEKGIVQFGKPVINITIPNLTVSPRVISAIFQGEKSSGSSLFIKMYTGEPVEAFDLRTTKRVNAVATVSVQQIHTQNVVGILEGSDPVLKNEYVAVGAHYDHVGMNQNAPGPDKIWNGADDDGSGTVAVMSIAEALAKGAQRPKRSMLFIWHAG